jgi:hypothetical protein
VLRSKLTAPEPHIVRAHENIHVTEVTILAYWLAYLGKIYDAFSFVRSFVRSFVGVRPFLFLYCTTVKFCCTCAVRDQLEAEHGQKKGHAPRAKGGAIIHRHLEVVIKGATNTDLLRSAAK